MGVENVEGLDPQDEQRCLQNSLKTLDRGQYQEYAQTVVLGESRKTNDQERIC